MNFFFGKKLYSGLKLLIDKKENTDENRFNIIINKKQIGWPFKETKFKVKSETTFIKTKRQRPSPTENDKNFKKIKQEHPNVVNVNNKKVECKKVEKGQNPNIQVSLHSNQLIIDKKAFKGTSLEKIFRKRDTTQHIPIKSKNLFANFPLNKPHFGYMTKPSNDPNSAKKNPYLKNLLNHLYNNHSKNSTHLKMESFDKISEQFHSLKLNQETQKKTDTAKVEMIDLDDVKHHEQKSSLIKNNINDILNTSFSGNYPYQNPYSTYFKEEPEQEINLTYQFKVVQGRQSSIQINYDDYKTLDVPAYLNDKIIMFYLKFLQSELAVEEIKGKFIILDTYFYQKLSKNELDEMSTPLINYNSVKKWTKQLNFFQNEYVIVPINQDDHWSLLIICHPGKIENCFKKVENNNSENPENSETPNYPLIIYLDSFYEDNARCRSIFKKYLYYEYAHKHLQIENEEKIMEIINNTHNYICEFVPNVPKQPNCYDCGIFLLAYAELFLFDPNYLLKAFKESKGNMANWFTPPFISSKRDSIQEMICEMMNKSEEELNQIVSKYRSTREQIMKTTYDVPMSTLTQFEFPFNMNKTDSNGAESGSAHSESFSKYTGSSFPSDISNLKDLI
jgi:hypothetical protein